MDVRLGILVPSRSVGNLNAGLGKLFETLMIDHSLGELPRVPKESFKRVLVSATLEDVDQRVREGLGAPLAGVGVRWPGEDPVNVWRERLATLPQAIGGTEIIFDVDVAHGNDNPGMLRDALISAHGALDRPLNVGLRFGSCDPYRWVRAFGRALRFVSFPIDQMPVPEMLFNAMVGASVRRCDVLVGVPHVHQEVLEAIVVKWQPALNLARLGGPSR